MRASSGKRKDAPNPADSPPITLSPALSYFLEGAQPATWRTIQAPPPALSSKVFSWADRVKGHSSAPLPAAHPESVPRKSPPSAPATAEKAKEEQVQLYPRGLVNSGNLCYANVVLQVLVWTAGFRQIIEKLQDSLPIPAFKPKDGSILPSIIRFLDEFAPNVPSKSAYTPHSIYSTLRHNPRFSAMRMGTQEDAEEFLGLFLQGLEDEVTALLRTHPLAATNGVNGVNGTNGTNGTWNEVGSKGKPAIQRNTVQKEVDNPLCDLFSGRLRSVVRVPGHRDSATIEPFERLLLSIQDPTINSVDTALDFLTSPEQISDYKPTSNSPPSRATKQILLDMLPSNLIVTLKRFEFDINAPVWTEPKKPKRSKKEVYRDTDGSVRKDDKYIKFEQELVIKSEWRLGGKSRPVEKYHLYAVVYHHGKQATGGHYTVAVRLNTPEGDSDAESTASISEPDSWVHIDDTSIRPISIEQVISQNGGIDEDEKIAYLLCYRK